MTIIKLGICGPWVPKRDLKDTWNVLKLFQVQQRSQKIRIKNHKVTQQNFQEQYKCRIINLPTLGKTL